jgi:hypothetical protein
LSTLRQKFSSEEWQQHLQELSEIERYACQLQGEDPDNPGMNAFVKKWYNSDATSPNFFKMARDVLLPELQRFKDHLLQVLAMQRQEDLELLKNRLQSTEKEPTTPPSPTTSSQP